MASRQERILLVRSILHVALLWLKPGGVAAFSISRSSSKRLAVTSRFASNEQQQRPDEPSAAPSFSSLSRTTDTTRNSTSSSTILHMNNNTPSQEEFLRTVFPLDQMDRMQRLVEQSRGYLSTESHPEPADHSFYGTKAAAKCEDIFRNFYHPSQQQQQEEEAQLTHTGLTMHDGDTQSSRMMSMDPMELVVQAWANCARALVHDKQKTAVSSSVLHSEIPVYSTRDAILRAQNILTEELSHTRPAKHSVQAYNVILHAWAQSLLPDALARIQELMKTMERKGISLNADSYSAFTDALLKNCSNRSIEKTINQIERTRNTMKKSGIPDKSPRTLNVLLKLYVRAAARDRDEKWCSRAGKILDSMKSQGDTAFQPDVETYTAVIAVHSKLGQASEAKLLFEEMRTRGLRPNADTYAAVIDASAFCKQKSPATLKKANQLLQEVLDDESIGNASPRPAESFIRCLAYSKDGRKAREALNILRTLRSHKNSDFRPDQSTYACAIECCARTKTDTIGKLEALKIAFAMYKTAKKDSMLSDKLFSSLLRCVGYLLPPGEEQTRIARELFSQATLSGLVNKGVIHSYQKACDSSVFHTSVAPLMDGHGHLHFDRIPESWLRSLDS